MLTTDRSPGVPYIRANMVPSLVRGAGLGPTQSPQAVASEPSGAGWGVHVVCHRSQPTARCRAPDTSQTMSPLPSEEPAGLAHWTMASNMAHPVAFSRLASVT